MKEEDFKIINGNNLEVLDTLPDNSIDAIVTDPPYELGFMGKKWDSTGIAYNIELWKKALRVLKPAGYLLAFGGTRTYHRIACAIEDAGFEIRDCIMWLYGSGFPKSHNIGLAVDEINGVESQVIGKGKSGEGTTHKRTMSSITKEGKSVFGGEYDVKKGNNKWAGWGTALKPAYEPIIVARKPTNLTIAQNCLTYGVGGINIDECRVELEKGYKPPIRSEQSASNQNDRKGKTQCDLGKRSGSAGASLEGRFPANVITDGSEEVAQGMPNTKSVYNANNKHETEIHRENAEFLKYGYAERYETGYNDEGSAMRYFYSAKASKKDRDEGLDRFEDGETLRKNIHPTVKPCSLMQYLVRLVTPRGGTVLDMFNGSGSTGKAVAYENLERDAGYKYIGIELSKEYCDISNARIAYVIKKEKEQEGRQMSIFDNYEL